MRGVKSIYFLLLGFSFKIKQNTHAILYQYNFSNEYSNVLEYNRSFCLTAFEKFIFWFVVPNLLRLEADCGPKKNQELEMINMKFSDFAKKIYPIKNICNGIEMVCIDDVRSFMETQTKKNLSGVSWNDLKKNLYLDSLKIDEFLNPCVVAVWYEKILNDKISGIKQIDIFVYTLGLTLMPFCSKKSIECIKEVYTWDNINH